MISLLILVLCVFGFDARSFLTWGLPLLVVNLFIYKTEVFGSGTLREVGPRLTLPLACLMVWLSLAGGFSGSVVALHEGLTINGTVRDVLVVAHSKDVLAFIVCDDPDKVLTTVERGSISQRVVLPFVTKREYPSIAKLVWRLFVVEGLDVAVRSSC